MLAIMRMSNQYALDKYTELDIKFDLTTEEPAEEFEEWIREIFNDDDFYERLLCNEDMDWSEFDDNEIMGMINYFNLYYEEKFGRESCKITFDRKIVIMNYSYVYACETTMDFIDYIKEHYEEEVSESDAGTEVDEWDGGVEQQ